MSCIRVLCRGQEQQRQTAGVVWERCAAIEALPRGMPGYRHALCPIMPPILSVCPSPADNRGAVSLRLKQQQDLVDDAIRELAEVCVAAFATQWCCCLARH